MNEEENKSQLKKHIKRTIKIWAIRILIPITIILVLALSIYGIFAGIGEKIRGIGTRVKEIFSLSLDEKSENFGKITINDSQVEKIIEAIEETGIELEDLKLIGDDANYNDPEVKEKNEEALKKYIRKFYEAQAVTQTIYLKENPIKELFKNKDLYGTVYIYRVNGETDDGKPINKDNPGTLLKYKNIEELQKLVKTGNIDAVRGYYSINEKEQLVIPKWTTSANTSTNEETNKSNSYIGLKTVNYKNVVSPYTTNINFFIYLAMITGNPEFVSAVADLAKNSEIHISILENRTQRTTTEVYYRTKNIWKGRDIDLAEDEEEEPEDKLPKKEAMKPETTTNTITSMPIQLKVTYVKTWFSEQNIEYEKEIIDETTVEELDSTNDSTLEDDGEALVRPPKGKEAIWYTDKRKKVTMVRTGYKYKEKNRSEVQDRTGEKGDQGVYDKNNNGKVDGGETINENSTFIGLMDDYFRIPNTNKYESVGNSNLVTGANMLFQLMENDPKLSKLEQLMKYIMYKYTGDKNYGVEKFAFDLFNAKEFRQTFGSGDRMLREYIFASEGGPKNEDGTKYVIYADSGGVLTVGHGIVIKYCEDEFLDAGYSIKVGEEVDIDFVTAIEKRKLQDFIDDVENLTMALELTRYQRNALVSRIYNCGTNGGLLTLRGSPSMDFVDSYLAYWNQETDDQYEERNPEADFTHKLYTQYMSQPINDVSGNSVLVGRRNSEWTLFQTGYYDRLGKWHTNGGDIIVACEELTEELLDRGVMYSLGPGLIWNDIERCYNQCYRCCCASYVAMALYKAGVFTPEDIEILNKCDYQSVSKLDTAFGMMGWEQIPPEEAEPGDIVLDSGSSYGGMGHALIYAGDGQCWDQNSAVYGEDGTPPTGTTTNWDILHGGLTIWRAP